jgi:hypothetical protein
MLFVACIAASSAYKLLIIWQVGDNACVFLSVELDELPITSCSSAFIGLLLLMCFLDYTLFEM